MLFSRDSLRLFPVTINSIIVRLVGWFIRLMVWQEYHTKPNLTWLCKFKIINGSSNLIPNQSRVNVNSKEHGISTGFTSNWASNGGGIEYIEKTYQADQWLENQNKH